MEIVLWKPIMLICLQQYAHTYDMFINLSILKLQNMYDYNALNAGIFMFK